MNNKMLFRLPIIVVCMVAFMVMLTPQILFAWGEPQPPAGDQRIVGPATDGVIIAEFVEHPGLLTGDAYVTFVGACRANNDPEIKSKVQVILFWEELNIPTENFINATEEWAIFTVLTDQAPVECYGQPSPNNKYNLIVTGVQKFNNASVIHPGTGEMKYMIGAELSISVLEPK
jgi:hypothetical protein